MKIHREKLKIAMARACMSTEELQKAAEMPRPTINNAITPLQRMTEPNRGYPMPAGGMWITGRR